MSTPTSATIIVAERVPAHAAASLVPNGSGWDAGEYPVALSPTPLDAQPSIYVQESWASAPYGQLGTVRLSAALAPDTLFLRLRWTATDPRTAITDNNVFADACAVLFPLDGRDAELSTMGDEARPVHAWHWRAGTEEPFVLNATGLGTTSRIPKHDVKVAAEWKRSQWTVVFSRPLSGEGVPLVSGAAVPVGIAVWRGAFGERAGIKSHTREWITLKLGD